MKKTSSLKSDRTRREDLRREYRFDYSRARRNRFARGLRGGSIAVLLEPDVAAVFQTSESVNGFLRSVISSLPRRPGSLSKKNAV